MSGPFFDPGAVGSLGFWYLAMFGGLIPFAAIRSRRHLEHRPLPPRKRYYLSVIAQQLIFFAITLATARTLGIDLFGPYRPTAIHVIASITMLAGAVGLLRNTWRAQVEGQDPRIQLITPVDRTDHLLWTAISFCAGVGEELTYRGVMFWLLMRLTGSIPVAVGVSVLAFAVGHAIQGWRSAAVVGLFAIGFHGLVLLTGSLVPAMVVHTGYDLIAGFSYGRFARRTGPSSA